MLCYLTLILIETVLSGMHNNILHSYAEINSILFNIRYSVYYLFDQLDLLSITKFSVKIKATLKFMCNIIQQQNMTFDYNIDNRYI